MADSKRVPERSEQGWLALSLVWLLLAYQRVISPFLGENCRFHPTCSRYAIDAVVGYGAARGSWLALKRVCRCHPLSEGGLDPVP